mmetsp:Transcript_35071/g.64054  ORF Transcript_35071/g.64054 Transcript_35071/m.64054 type:complete len:233 (+) Transcript_35071:3-701(+)
MEAEIRPREGTVIHLKLFDQDLAALRDRGVGHCAVPISEVQKDAWHGVRPIALEPFDTKKPKEWASLIDCRLFFSVGWEGSAARVKHKMPSFKKASDVRASGQLGARIARRRARSGRTTPASAVSLGDTDARIDDDELLDAAPARPAGSFAVAAAKAEVEAEVTWAEETAWADETAWAEETAQAEDTAWTEEVVASYPAHSEENLENWTEEAEQAAAVQTTEDYYSHVRVPN